MPPRVNADARRREVVSRAADLFDRTGYHATNVAAVAEASGIRKPTLYHYFSGKDEILFSIHEEFIDLLIEKHRRRPASPAAEALLAVMVDLLELMRTHRGHVRVFFEHHRELSDEQRETIEAKRDDYRQMVEDVVAGGVASGEFRPVDPRLTTLAVFGMCNWAYRWYRSDGPLASDEVAGFFHDLLCNGLRGR